MNTNIKNKDSCCHKTTTNHIQDDLPAETKQSSGGKNIWKVIAIVFMVLFVLSVASGADLKEKVSGELEDYQAEKLRSAVLPSEGIDLPIIWGDLGVQLVETGVIDRAGFMRLYNQQVQFEQVAASFLNESIGSPVKMTSDNAPVLLNLLWAMGLSNKNPVLEQGPMVDSRYGGDPGRFASTGGWTLASGSAMDHYSMHEFVILTPEQQRRVEEVASNIYRPCCGNSVYFPDCNHGMAMLGLLELLAANGASEEQMYEIALQVNSYWFPDTYLTIAKYQKEKLGKKWEEVDAKEVLGPAFSSAAGYRGILNEISPPTSTGGPSCGV